MANTITISALGAENKTLNNLDTVQDCANALNLGDKHSVIVNGAPADYDTQLNDFEFVAFGEQVKGGDTSSLIDAIEAWAEANDCDASDLVW